MENLTNEEVNERLSQFKSLRNLILNLLNNKKTKLQHTTSIMSDAIKHECGIAHIRLLKTFRIL